MARRFILILMTVLSTVIMAQRPSGGQRPSGARPDMADRPKIGVVFGSVEDGDSGTPIEFATISILAFDEDKVITGGVTDAKGGFASPRSPSAGSGPKLVSWDMFPLRSVTSDSALAEAPSKTSGRCALSPTYRPWRPQKLWNKGPALK